MKFSTLQNTGGRLFQDDIFLLRMKNLLWYYLESEVHDKLIEILFGMILNKT